MPNRACDKHDSGPFMPCTFGNSASSPTTQSSSTSSLVTLARSDHLPWMSFAENPGVDAGTRNPRTTPSSFAHTSATCAIEPFVNHQINAFDPAGSSIFASSWYLDRQSQY